MNQTLSQNSLTQGSHVMGICRLTQTMFWFIPQSQYYVYFSVHFVSHIMILKYLQGFHPQIWDYSIKQISQNYTQALQDRGYVRHNVHRKFFVSWYRCSFCGYKLNSFPIWCLYICGCKGEGLVIYPIQTKYTLFLPTLDGCVSTLRPK